MKESGPSGYLDKIARLTEENNKLKKLLRRERQTTRLNQQREENYQGFIDEICLILKGRLDPTKLESAMELLETALGKIDDFNPHSNTDLRDLKGNIYSAQWFLETVVCENDDLRAQTDEKYREFINRIRVLSMNTNDSSLSGEDSKTDKRVGHLEDRMKLVEAFLADLERRDQDHRDRDQDD